MQKELVIAGRTFRSRLFLGTGKYPTTQSLSDSIRASGCELVTVALRRVDVGNAEDDILSGIDRSKVEIMLNTSGARTAEEAIRIAEFGKRAGFQWIKLEIHPDPTYLLPDPVETLKAAQILVEKGFTVLPYINADPVLAKRLEDAGVHAVMPLAAPIGSGQGEYPPPIRPHGAEARTAGQLFSLAAPAGSRWQRPYSSVICRSFSASAAPASPGSMRQRQLPAGVPGTFIRCPAPRPR